MTNGSLVLITELGIGLSVSVAVLFRVQAVLHDLLKEICHRETRADFWSTFTRLMLLISPLLVVILFSHALSEDAVSWARIFRDTLLHTLLGQFIGLLIVGGILLNFSRGEQDAQQKRASPDDAMEGALK